ncbi:alpha-mannosidase [Fervidobacterium islandicum]|uniref:alpha-mannosidase n=1 Tax=Fervidobacterium islandicum TaxID=2423 RepID=UPI003A6BD52E
MYRKRQIECSRFYKLLDELMPYCVVKVEELSWKHNTKSINLPYEWNDMSYPAVFSTEFQIKPSENSHVCYLRGWFGGESLVRIDGKPFGEINEYHREVNLTQFCDGEKHEIIVETMPRGLFGTKSEPVFSEGFLIFYDADMLGAVRFFRNVVEVVQESADEGLATFLIDSLDKCLHTIEIPRDTENYLHGLNRNESAKHIVSSVWEPPIIPTLYRMWRKDVRESLLNAYKELISKLLNASIRFPMIGKVYLAGHAHIDYAWLWPVEETKRKIVRTFANAVQLAKRYKDFVFIQSSAQMYEDLKESYPELFEQIKDLVNKGQWEPVGGMWVESDCNIPSVESLIRQFYYGQKFFEEHFGRFSKVAWLPDVFGFSWVLPQVLKESGIEFFVTTKLNWNESNDFPYDICKWRGIDGTEVVYYNYKNLEEGYNGRISAKSIINTWQNFRQKELTDKVFLTFGYGDGGGGPTEEMCENYYALKEIPGIPDVEYSTTENFFEKLKEDFSAENLPTWDNELYLELHRGTLTSQSRTKRLHKIAEEYLRITEILNALYDGELQQEIDKLWKILLRNEFHDILPGSAIHEVYETTNNELSYIISRCKELQESIVSGNKASSSGYITLFNTSSFEQGIEFELERSLELDFNGKPLRKVCTYDGKYFYKLIGDDVFIEPLGFATLNVDNLDNVRNPNESIPSNNTTFMISRNERGYHVENMHLKVDIFNDGSLQIYNKHLRKSAFKGKGNLMALYKDVPAYWDNWDIDYRSRFSEKILKADDVFVVEDNELRKVLKATYSVGGSVVEQFFIIGNDNEEVVIRTLVDWHQRRTVLKVKFPTNVLSRIAKFDIDGGYIERATHRNTNFEKARFEVLAHRWVDISQYDFGVSIINDGKYGHSVEGSNIELTVLKAGIYPDFYDDEGKQEFSYAIYLHGACDVKDIVQRADKFNKRIIVFEGLLSQPKNLLDIKSDNFKVLSYRKIGEKKVVRICEQVGSSGELEVVPKFLFSKAYLTDILENAKKDLEVCGGSVKIEYEPFKIYTLVIE